MKRRLSLNIGLGREARPTAIGPFISTDMTLPGIPLPLDAGAPGPEPEERWTLGGQPVADDPPMVEPLEPVGRRGRRRSHDAR